MTGRWGWLGQPPSNWFLRFGIPFTAIFGIGFLYRLFFADEMGGGTVVDGVTALLAMIVLAVGIAVERSRR